MQRRRLKRNGAECNVDVDAHYVLGKRRTADIDKHGSLSLASHLR